MQVVSVINYKGGVGKTTVTANLAAELAARGKSVLLLDMDPQCSLTFSFFRPEEWDADLKDGKTVKAWFDSLSEGATPLPLRSLIATPQRAAEKLSGDGKLHLIASHLGLINVDLELATQVGGATLQQSKKNYLRVHKRLAEGLKEIADDEYDLVLIDCPPNFNITTKNAIVASDRVLIPAKPDYLSTLGIDYLQRSLKELVDEFNDYLKIDDGTNMDEIAPKIMGVLFTMIQITSNQPIRAQKPFMSQTAKLGIPVFSNYFRENKTIFADSPQYGVPVVLNRYTNPTHAVVVKEIESVVEEFKTRLGI
ncbi:ParA family protein [Rosistilla oblonga]|uniref:ParA family protein n=1 Tax=Rosistilla oblonga TaxID=2527990 RepID=UPI003A97AC59